MEVSRQDKFSPITGELFIVGKIRKVITKINELKNILGTVIQGKTNATNRGIVLLSNQ